MLYCDGAGPSRPHEERPKRTTSPMTSQSDQNPIDPHSGPAKPAMHGPLGRTVGGGVAWMFACTIISKLATTVAQAFLGWWLLPKHFSSFAYATAAAGFLMLAKDASVPNWIVQKGAGDHDKNAGPGFFLALTYNVLCALVMVALARPLATYWFEDESVARMLMVIAISLPISTIGAMSQAKLRSQMRFKSLTIILTFSGIIRQIATIALAWGGFNELSLSLPIVITSVYEAIAGFIVTRDQPWRLPPQLERWRAIFGETWYLTQSTIANFATDWGPYLVLPFFMFDEEGKRQTGFYFWGYLLLGQIAALLSNNLFVIFLPVLTRLREEPARLADAYLRALRTLMLASCFSCVLLAAMISPLEHLVWRGKWAATTEAVVLLAIFFPWKASFGLTSATFMAIGSFRRYSFCTWYEAILLMCAAVFAGKYHPFASEIVLYTGMALLIGRAVVMIVLMKTLRQKSRALVRATAPAWITSLVAGAAGVAAERLCDVGPWVLSHIPLGAFLDEYGPLQQVAGDIVRPLGTAQFIATSVIDSIRCAIAGGTCIIVGGGLARLFLSADLQDAIGQAPSKLRAPVRTLLLLPTPE